MLDNRDEPLLDAGEMNHPSRRIMNRILKLFEVQRLIMGQTNFRDGTLVSRERNRRGVDPEIPWRRHQTGVYQTSDLSSLRSGHCFDNWTGDFCVSQRPESVRTCNVTCVILY